MRARSLIKCLPAICRAITNQKGINLVFQGPARTDGKTIYSDPLPVTATDDEIAIIVGDIDHECAHINYTDFNFSNEVLESFPIDKQVVLKGIHNALEDTMIERRAGDDYIGCRETLAVSVELMDAELAEHLAQDETTPAEILNSYLDAWGRTHVLYQNIPKVYKVTREAILELLEPKGVVRLDSLLATYLYSSASTQDTWALTEKVVRLIEDIAQDKNDESDPDNKTDPESPPQNQSGAPETGESTAPDQPDPNAPPQPTQAGQGAQKILDDKKADTTPLFDRKKKADDVKDEAAARDGFIGTDNTSPMTVKDDLVSYSQIRDSVSGEIRDLQSRIIAEYQALTRRRSVVSESGRIDGRRLTKAVMGDMRIFRERTKRTLPYPAVSLVLDCSGSMKGEELALAKQALIAVAEVNENLRVKTEIIAFEGDNVSVIKRFDDALNNVSPRIGGLSDGGGTPTAEALWEAGKRIVTRKESRKLIMLITDGTPDKLDHAIEISNMIRTSNIELYGLGIGSASVSKYCTSFDVINNPADIASAVLGALRDRVLRAA